MTVIVRGAEAADAPAINAIYNPYILESVATFETEPYSDESRVRWLEALAADPRHPVFVAQAGASALAGFANAAPFDARQAYETSVKVSVFVAPNHHGKGVAGALYETLFQALQVEDVHRAYALIVSPNAASAVLHQRFGFAHVATLNAVGRKFGRFHDVMWFEKKLS